MPDRRRAPRDDPGNRVRSVRRIAGQLGGARIAIALLLLTIALQIAALSWGLPLLRDAESALYDLRAANLAPGADTDKRITLVVYTADTNRATGQISPVDRTILAKALAQIDRLGASAIAIDVLFDSPQDDDALLQGTLKEMKTPVFLAFADAKTNPDAITYEQEQDLRTYVAAAASPKVKPASILLETDTDGVARRWPRQYVGLPPLLAVALSEAAGDGDNRFMHYTGPIRFRMPLSSDRPVFDKIPIDLLADPDSADLVGNVIKGRYVMIGGDFSDFDKFDTPFTRTGNPITGERQMIGVEVHASMLAQLLDGALPRSISTGMLWVAGTVVILLGAATALYSGRGAVVGLAVILQFGMFLATPVLLERWGFDTLGVPSMGWIVGWLLAYTAINAAMRVIGAKEREFAQGALGKYLPRSIANEIVRNPDRLSLHGEKRELFCVFSDLEGFTKLSHALKPEVCAALLNDYLDRLSEIVLEHGGTLDKFVGDAVVAFWGAPIAYPDDGERAIRAAWAMYQAGEDFRGSVAEGLPPVGRTRVGVHFGEAVVGNFGGDKRIQYTALGDAMNTAARLESANKTLKTKVLVSREAAERSGLDWFRPMGTVTLRGRATPVEVFEVLPDLAEDQRVVVNELVEAHAAGDSRLVQRLTTKLAQFGQDDALGNLFERLRATAKGESYVLG
ncbi:adenylate/guanylate cyclase domain-containing protein [Novosphingobium sp. Gsoil 351]|uniref:adenylate/guanylate cyclase domain-containing protein n=1 Tax=Novosphingobium sp. Gsoil 351 TaxID=2675225 RepID=UPI0012B4D65D|nr:adenylate/guanylate cyclase domain-containing protein [Novosphingobium sp. Gsoil 351]QGN53486.1 CHASE2 domain-containing protein [Novosphingobium sp. Gsoil 351]